MEGCIIKVTPEILNAVSSDVFHKIDRAQNAFQQIDSLIGEMSSHWNGDGYDRMRLAYNSQKDDYEQIFRALSDHTENLQLIASGYNVTEKKAVDISNILPSDIIQ